MRLGLQFVKKQVRSSLKMYFTLIYLLILSSLHPDGVNDPDGVYHPDGVG